jgi:hypothetical protein
MRELRGSAFIGLPQFDSNPRPRLVGELPCHGQPMRRLRLGHLAARQLSLAMVDNQSSPGPDVYLDDGAQPLRQ